MSPPSRRSWQRSTSDLSRYEEVVFCGYGEPTCAFDMLKRVAAEVKRRYSLPVRVNTNGQGSLICGRDIAPEFEGIVDTVSISLNTPNADEYAAIVRSRFGDAAFPACSTSPAKCASTCPTS